MADYHPGLMVTARHALEGLPQIKRAEFLVEMLRELKGPSASRLLVDACLQLNAEVSERIEGEISAADQPHHHLANIERHGGDIASAQSGDEAQA